MDRNKTKRRLSVVLSLLVVGGLIVLSMVTGARADQVNATYTVTVVTSFGTSFTTCFRFDNPDSGDLSIDALGQVITYRHGQLGTVPSRFKAVSRSDGFEIMFFGEFVEALGQMTGEAINEFGATFVYSGGIDADCASGALTATNPFR